MHHVGFSKIFRDDTPGPRKFLLAKPKIPPYNKRARLNTVVGWRFNGLHDGEKMVDLSQTIFMRSTNEAFKRTNTHTHTHTQTHRQTNTQTHARADTN